MQSVLQSKTKSKSSIGPIMKPDGTTEEEDQEKVEVIYHFFASVFTCEDLNYIPPFPDRQFQTTLDDITFTEDMVLNRLVKLDQSKSPGPDEIHNRVLKELAHEIAQPLADLFNDSMKTSTVPDSWKVANVIPIFKKGANAIQIITDQY